MAIEKPKYEVIETHGDIEIRRYEPMIVARTRVDGDFEQAGNIAFRRLAGYIFGDNASEEKISMTAPVMQAPVPATDGAFWVMFMMPGKYAIGDLPKPTSQDVELERVAGATFAAIRYKGGWSEKKYRENEKRLREIARGLSAWRPVGESMWARYNPPIVPSWFRTNEILIRVEPRETSATN
ncbi:MAG: heme-binding protein [Pseudomonadales bacterium]|nr:heme-binding protein [Pseudomonadales bacterium]